MYFNKIVFHAHKHLCQLIHSKTEDQHLKPADPSIYASERITGYKYIKKTVI